MSKYDYEMSLKIAAEDHPFYALIMTAMRQANTENLRKLKLAFPETYEELRVRRESPGGLLQEEWDEIDRRADQYIVDVFGPKDEDGFVSIRGIVTTSYDEPEA